MTGAKARREAATTDRHTARSGTARDRERLVDAFVQAHFTWPGTLHLHRAAFGFDILRAPANVMLAPVFVVVRLLAWLCRRLGFTRAARWLRDRRLLLRTAVSAEVEAAVVTVLLGAALPAGHRVADRAGLARAILASPRLREVMRSRGSVEGAQTLADRITAAISDYSGTRAAMAEFTTALITLAIGAVAFQALTPGLISMAPGVAEAVSRGTVIADFPLGATLGRAWYGVFPVGPSPGLVAATVLGLMALGSVIGCFAGIIADPVQAALGIHRRRLLRLFDTLEAELHGAGDRPFATSAHILARVFDLWDAALSLLRAFRG